MKDTTLYIMVGAPGSGKSYFAKNVLATNDMTEYISRDEVRFSMVNENEEYFSKEDAVYDEFCDRIRYALGCNEYYYVIADASHLNWASRRKLLRKLDINTEYINVIPVIVRPSLETCYKQNDLRSGRANVPHNVIANMYKTFTHPKNDPYKYTAIMEVCT